MNFHLRIWKQEHHDTPGRFEAIEAHDIPAEASLLEMLDIVNERFVNERKMPIAFESDCREGICGTCSMVINGMPQGPGRGAACQVYMRSFQDGETITLEPYRVASFPLVKDLVVDRSAYDRIIQSGGFITEHTGGAPDANTTLISKKIADRAMDAASCIGCGACAAACPNSSAMLFVGAKVTHLSLLPQGQPERRDRARTMVRAMDEEGFGNCSNYYACEAVCPSAISASVIATLNREFVAAEIAEAIGAV
ncbi:MAG: succinate dehydrogenase [Verrucomicrobia bacterium RIFCSPHIGHO2_12_FULL_41_10]|nr:MAG: succinate dehydrogenase [Verrucomicrobia bacterium RIFCSPHIGHO2_12_FULL_41_10]HLB33399.1 succinate dehydrogenase/fumarate reductase iron-sulfur subunit [Chthoniobacterales bacterium]